MALIKRFAAINPGNSPVNNLIRLDELKMLRWEKINSVKRIEPPIIRSFLCLLLIFLLNNGYKITPAKNPE